MNNCPNLIELSDTDKSNLITTIFHCDIKQLRSEPIHTYNLNYLIEDKDIQFDQCISPLLAACFIGKLEVFLTIISNDYVDVNFCSMPEQYSPLMVACYKGFYEIARMLIERNSDVKIANRRGQSPFLFCFSRLEVSSFRYENKKICMMLLDLLLSKGADINIRFDQVQGYTVLMKLASSEISDKDKLNNTKEMIKFLLERGADITIKGFDDKSVFDLIVAKGTYREEIINTLKTTKQLHYYTEDNDVKLDQVKKRVSKGNSLNSNGVIIENVEARINCCIIGKVSSNQI